MENKRYKIIITIFVITTIIAGSLAVYFFIDKNKEVNNLQTSLNQNKTELEKVNKELSDTKSLLNNTGSKETTESKNDDNITKASIPVSDLFGVDSTIIAKIVDGNLMYYLNTDNSNYFSTTISDDKYVKLDSDVKRIKSVSISSGVQTTFLVIKNDGSVYDLHVGNDYNDSTPKVIYSKYEPFDGEKIDDINSIIGFSGARAGIEANVTLLDGTKKDINWGNGV